MQVCLFNDLGCTWISDFSWFSWFSSSLEGRVGWLDLVFVGNKSHGSAKAKDMGLSPMLRIWCAPLQGCDHCWPNWFRSGTAIQWYHMLQRSHSSDCSGLRFGESLHISPLWPGIHVCCFHLKVACAPSRNTWILGRLIIFTLLFPVQNPLDFVSFLLKILPIQLPMTRDSIFGWTIWRQDILDGGQDMKDLFASKTIETVHNWNKKTKKT